MWKEKSIENFAAKLFGKIGTYFPKQVPTVQFEVYNTST